MESKIRPHLQQEDQLIMSFSNNDMTNKKSSVSQRRSHSKHRHFIQDDEYLNDTSKKVYNIQFINDDKVIEKEKISPEMIDLLQNCKISIKSLQEQLQLKNEQNIKLSSENQSLNCKLLEAQKQVKRTHEILSIYIKQSEDLKKVKQFVTVSEVHQSHLTLQIKNQTLKLQSQSQKQMIDKIIKQNQYLSNQNYNQKDQIHKLNSQINLLEQKIYKMGKGVGKALSTIKKNNSDSIFKHNPQINICPETLNKQNERDKINGKIVYKNIQLFSDKKVIFQTPSKKFTSRSKLKPNQRIDTTADNKFLDKITFSTLKCERQMEQISNKAKKFDQIDRIQSLLNRMQQLSKKDSQEDCQE